ncbi:hypothetical protein SAY86_027117 [Trapa natans]|uniref:Uncharacterized protein n=1 Tax=Trapa natans TaxID=22666 RepID=A0AAN7KTT2_TRANT|nr:hypothetical protein SAY86_027117 [Trapa natans]
MAQKHLRELLSEDQEPFLLSNYITDRLTKLSRPTKASPPSFSAGALYKSVCLFSIFPDSPDCRKSPLFDFASPQKSPNRIFLHVPAKTAALLVEAAVRIQQRSASTAKLKPAKKGMLGSILKRLTVRKPREMPKRETDSEWRIRRSFGSENSQRRSFGSENAQLKSSAAKKATPPRCLCRGDHSRWSSGLWSESNGERSLDLETSTSGSSESIELVPEEEGRGDVYATFDQGLCESPYRFVLRRSPSSSGVRTPDFPTQAASPARVGSKKEADHCDVESSKRRTPQVEDEETEQCSPVSVLDPPFEDSHDHEEEEEDGFDYECSFAKVHSKFI